MLYSSYKFYILYEISIEQAQSHRQVLTRATCRVRYL